MAKKGSKKNKKQADVVVEPEATEEAKPKRKKKPAAPKHSVMGMRENTAGPVCYEVFTEGRYTVGEAEQVVEEKFAELARIHKGKPQDAKGAVNFWMKDRQQAQRNFRLRITEDGIIQAIPWGSPGKTKKGVAEDSDFEAVFSSTVSKPKRAKASKSSKKSKKKAKAA